MKLSKTLPFAILGMATVALAGCSNEFDGYKFYKLIEEVPATCTMGGMKAHYESEPNDKGETIYLDVDKKKVDYENLIIPATGHNMTFHKEVYSTCTEEGTVAHYHCENCGLNFEDEAGKTLIEDLHKSTVGHVMDHVWTPSPTGNTHYHKCAREGCNHIEDEEDCVCDKQIVKDEFKVEGQENTYYKSCVCGRKGTETFIVEPKEVVDIGETGWEDKVRQSAGLDEYDPSKDTQVTLGDIGISATDYVTIPSQSVDHIFGTYDISENGIDFVFNVKFTKIADAYITVYLGNQRNEDGLQFRLMASRDDAYMEGYYFSTDGGLVKDDGTAFYSEPNNNSYFMTKPGISENKEIEIKLTPVPHLSNDENDMYKVSVKIGGYEFKKSEADSSPIDLTVGFPKGYFRNESYETIHNIVRISSYAPNTAPNAAIKDKVFPPRFILMDEMKNCVGSKLFEDAGYINLPDLSSNGRKFVGYYDTKGVQFNNEYEVSNRTIVYPHFVEVGTDASRKVVTLSDLNMLDAGLLASTTNNEIAGEFEEGFARVPVDSETKSVQISFVTQFKFAKSRGGKVVDDYFQFGLPYDYKDNQTRFLFRINAQSGLNHLAGYFGHQSTSMGAHGTEGTYYTFDNFSLIEGVSYLITLSYEPGETYGLCYSLSIQNLATFESATRSVDGVEFINSTDFSFTNPYRNYFSVIRSRADAVLTMKNAW